MKILIHFPCVCSQNCQTLKASRDKNEIYKTFIGIVLSPYQK